ncbi:MAG TPA: hypothetical protein VMA73_06200 [Streptosporangiaceae bacterium]|nr:hypothetical protein [Streptosporangiaceae bacterium]
MDALHGALHDFLSLAGESEGDYLVVPLVPDPRRDSEDTAKKLLGVLGQLGVPGELARLHLAPDIASALHGAAMVAELRTAVRALHGHLDSGDNQEAVYQTWCERHAWAFGNAHAYIVIGRSADWSEAQQQGLHGLNANSQVVTVGSV